MKIILIESASTSATMENRIFYTLCLLAVLESSWSYFQSDGLERAVRQGAEVSPAAEQRVFAQESANRDMVTINMFKVYEKYSKEPQSQKEGNTVRSFKALPSEWQHLYLFKFTDKYVRAEPRVVLFNKIFMRKTTK